MTRSLSRIQMSIHVLPLTYSVGHAESESRSIIQRPKPKPRVVETEENEDEDDIDDDDDDVLMDACEGEEEEEEEKAKTPMLKFGASRTREATPKSLVQSQGAKKNPFKVLSI